MSALIRRPSGAAALCRRACGEPDGLAILGSARRRGRLEPLLRRRAPFSTKAISPGALAETAIKITVRRIAGERLREVPVGSLGGLEHRPKPRFAKRSQIVLQFQESLVTAARHV